MIWAFDVDGTLVGSIRGDRARPGAAALLAALHDGGHVAVLWSAGGADYAERKAHEHALAGWVAGYYAKDRRDPDGRYAIDGFPAVHAPDVFVDDAPGDLPSGARVCAVSPFLGGNVADAGLIALLADLDALVTGAEA